MNSEDEKSDISPKIDDIATKSDKPEECLETVVVGDEGEKNGLLLQNGRHLRSQGKDKTLHFDFSFGEEDDDDNEVSRYVCLV